MRVRRPELHPPARETSLDEYERARSEGTHFLLAPGHEDERVERVERVVEQQGRRFAIVEKFNRVVARTVRELNPRVEPA